MTLAAENIAIKAEKFIAFLLYEVRKHEDEDTQ